MTYVLLVLLTLSLVGCLVLFRSVVYWHDQALALAVVAHQTKRQASMAKHPAGKGLGLPRMCLEDNDEIAAERCFLENSHEGPHMNESGFWV